MSQQDQVAGRFQQCLPVLATLALGLWIAYESFTVEDPQPYLFPQLISVAMIGLSAAALFRAIRGGEPHRGGYSPRPSAAHCSGHCGDAGLRSRAGASAWVLHGIGNRVHHALLPVRP